MSFEQYLLAHHRQLLRFAAVLCGNTIDAQDLAQTSLMHAYRSWNLVAGASSPHAYVRRIMLHDYLKSRRAGSQSVLVADVERAAGVAGDHADVLAERDEIVGLLAALPPKQRAAVVLRYYADLDDAAIAQTLGCTQATVRSNMARALARLRVEVGGVDVGAR